MGAISGNPFQMPGAFVLHCGRSVGGFQHESASDRPDYAKLVRKTQPAEDGMAIGLEQPGDVGSRLVSILWTLQLLRLIECRPMHLQSRVGDQHEIVAAVGGLST